MRDWSRDILDAVLIGLLALSLWGHYQTGQDLQRVCELIGPHDLMILHPLTDRQEVDNICIAHQPDD